MSQMLDYPREVPAMWQDLAHLISGADLPRGSAARAVAFTDEIPARAAAAEGRGAGMRHLAACMGAVVACLAYPGMAGLITQMLG